MSKKTLMALVVVLAVLVAAMWMRSRPAAAPENTPAAPGTLMPVDMSTVTAITIDDSMSTTHLAQVEGVWSVAEQNNYPADLDRLRQMMRSLDGMEAGQIADANADHLAEFGLVSGGESAPLRIRLEHGQGTTVLTLGKTRMPQSGEMGWGPSPGRYVRVDEGPVQLIKEDIRMVQADSGQWWDRKLLEVAADAIRQVTVGSGDAAYVMNRDTNGMYTLVGAAEGETVDAGAANRLFNALRSLRAEKMLSEAEGGGAKFRGIAQYKAVTEGVSYLVKLGEARPDEGGTRPVQIEVTATAEATPDQQAVAAAANKKLEGWTFLIPPYVAEPFDIKKEALVKKAPPVPVAPAETQPEVAPAMAPAAAPAAAEEKVPEAVPAPALEAAPPVPEATPAEPSAEP